MANCAGAYRTWAERLGKRSRTWDGLSCADLELPVALPPNNATVLREPMPGEADGLLDRAREFFAERPGGPYELWSLWPIPELSAVQAWPTGTAAHAATAPATASAHDASAPRIRPVGRRTKSPPPSADP